MSSSPARTRLRHRAPWLVGCSLWVLALAWPSTAHAAPPSDESQEVSSDVVLVRITPEDPRLSARLEAELDIAGLEVQRLDWPEPQEVIGPSLLDELESRAAGAAIEIYFRDDRIEVWVADHGTGTALTRRFDRQDDAREQARTLAVGAVELLRASQVEQPEDPLEPTPDDPEDPFVEPDTPPEVPFVPKASLSISPLIGGSPGGLGMTGHLEAAVRWAVRRPLLLSFDVWIPVFANQSPNEPGVSARSFIVMAFVEPQWSPTLKRAPWFHPSLGLGLGAAILSVRGEVVLEETDQAEPVKDVVAGFAANAHVDLGFAVHPRVWLRAGTHLGILQPAFRINILESKPTYGLPFFMGTVGIEFWI